jgi:hypothetical protein
VTKLLESAKVRKQLAIKGAAKCLAKIRRLLQAYALARPAVRFRLHVLKAKNDKVDFIYAPKSNANIEDAALKIIGKECALQCDWTALEANGFELHAFLPRPTAVGVKIANHGAFISIDSRPVSAVRGSLKKIANAVRDSIRKANNSVREVKDPFFCLNIICPTDSYDPNIEPAKDDVIFGDEQSILGLVQRLLMTYYPDNTAQTDGIEDTNDAAHTEMFQIPAVEESSPQPCTPSSMQQDNSIDNTERPDLTNHSDQPCWTSSMYGIDEEDVIFLQNNASNVVHEEEGRLDASVSNPWTIARMNSPVKSRTLSNNGQLPSPAKSQSDPCSSNSEHMPDIFSTVDTRTPRNLSQTNVQASTLDEELQRGIQRLPRYTCAGQIVPSHSTDQTEPMPLFEQRIKPICMRSTQPHISNANFLPPAAGRRSQKPSKALNNKSLVPLAPPLDDTWFGRPMRNAPVTSRPKKRPRQSDPMSSQNDDTYNSERSLVLPIVEHPVETRLSSRKNTDIRNFLGRSRRESPDVSPAMFGDCQPYHIKDQLRTYAERHTSSQDLPCSPQLIELYTRPTGTASEMNALFQSHQSASAGPSSSPTHNTLSSAKTRPESSLRRHQTADNNLHRIKSSTLPLNHVPHGFELHNLALIATTSVSSISKQACKFDLSAQSLDWGYDSTDVFDAFASPASEQQITEWVIKIDNMLSVAYKHEDGVGVRGALHEGIQRRLDMRNSEEGVRGSVEAPRFSSPVLDEKVSLITDKEDGVRVIDVEVRESDSTSFQIYPEHQVITVKSDEEEDTDFSQFVDLDGNVGKQNTPVQDPNMEDDLGDGIDDEMLMDL